MSARSIHTIHIFCDGGLGNRINSLLGGILLSQKTGGKPVIYWPVNNWCQCEFTDIFDTDIIAHNYGVSQVWREQIDSYFMVVENPTTLNPTRYLDTSMESVEFVKQNKVNVVYMHTKPPNFSSRNQLIQILSNFKIQPTIVEHVFDFINTHGINKNVYAVHIRKTDNKRQADVNFLYNEIEKNRSQRYFVCSDDKETEELFSKLPNVTVHVKEHYVEKMVEGSWNEKITDTEGRTFDFNVLRSKKSVIEGMQDILILSRCRLAGKTTKSTFWQMAEFYSTISI